jgi:hypothetical protein
MAGGELKPMKNWMNWWNEKKKYNKIYLIPKTNCYVMWKGCPKKEKLQEFINGSHLPLDK